MRRTIRRTTRLATLAVTPVFVASAVLMGGTATAAPEAEAPTRGSIHEEASQQAAETYRAQARGKQKALQSADITRDKAVEIALSRVGKAYAAGRVGPNAFDCSGLIVYAFDKVGVKVPRVSYAQYRATERIKLKDARPGDLAFYFRNGAHHVAMYIGDGKVVHASTYGVGVVLGTVKGTPWTNRHFTGMGRVKIKTKA